MKAPRRFDLMRPRQCYLICATPRTGSTLICETLRLSGLLGVPKEYFEYLKKTGLPRQPAQYFLPCEEGGRHTARFLQLLGFPKLRLDHERIAEYRSSYQQYLQRVLNCGTTPNGVFGAKMMWGHLSDFMELLSGDPDLSSSRRVHQSLQATFPDLHYIFVTRTDKLRQAISLWKAIQSQQWRMDLGAAPPQQWRTPGFDFEAIDYLRRRMIAHDNCWRRYFRGADIKPLVLCYEEFAGNVQAVRVQIHEFLGLPADGVIRCATPLMLRQSDGQTDEWLERFAAELEARSKQLELIDERMA